MSSLIDLRGRYSYRDDPAVADFNDEHGLVVFDHECVFCSTFVRQVFARDTGGYFHFTAAQSPLGQALYNHYGLDCRDFSTNLVLIDGRLHTKMDAFVAVMRRLGGWSRAFAVLGFLPSPLANHIYDFIARNRYRIFGRYDTCFVPSEELRRRLIG